MADNTICGRCGAERPFATVCKACGGWNQDSFTKAVESALKQFSKKHLAERLAYNSLTLEYPDLEFEDHSTAEALAAIQAATAELFEIKLQELADLTPCAPHEDFVGEHTCVKWVRENILETKREIGAELRHKISQGRGE